MPVELPRGSYHATSEDIKVEETSNGLVLTAKCRKANGDLKESTLEIPKNLKHFEVTNQDGDLTLLVFADAVNIMSVKCIQPSSAIGPSAKWIFGTLGGGAGMVAGISTALATGGILAFAIPVGAAGGASAGISVLKGIDELVGGTDELFICSYSGQWKGKLPDSLMKDFKVWPQGEKYHDIKSQQTLNINHRSEFNGRPITVELMEYNLVTENKHMGYLTVPPYHQTGSFTYFVPNEEEGSAYMIEIRVE